MSKLIPLTELVSRVPGLTYWVAYRRHREGKLRAVKIGRALCTTEEWLHEFIEAAAVGGAR